MSAFKTILDLASIGLNEMVACFYLTRLIINIHLFEKPTGLAEIVIFL